MQKTVTTIFIVSLAIVIPLIFFYFEYQNHNQRQTMVIALNSGSYVVQAASFRGLTQAEQLRNQLLAEHFPAYILQKQSGQKLFYLIQIGPYASLDEAENEQFRLKSLKSR